MRFLVVLDSNSIVGAVYARGHNDGFINDGCTKHPALDCTEVTTDGPYYLHVKRDLSRHGGDYQFIQIPHSSVAVIHHYADEGEKPFGFVSVDAPSP